MKKKIFATAVFTVMLALITSVSFAQRGQGFGMNNQQNGCDQNKSTQCMIPDLTQEQQAQIKTLRIEQMKASNTHRADMKILRAEYQKLVSSDNVDMKAVNNKIDEITDMRAAQMKQRVAHRQEVRKLLTDDQKVFFDNTARRGGACSGDGFGRGQGHRQGADRGHGSKRANCNGSGRY